MEDRPVAGGPRGTPRALLLPAGLFLAAVAGLVAWRLSGPGVDGAAHEALAGLVAEPADVSAWRALGARALVALGDAGAVVAALALVAANLSALLLVRARRGTAVARDGSAEAGSRDARVDGAAGATLEAKVVAGPVQARPVRAPAEGIGGGDAARAQLEIALAELDRLRALAALREDELREVRESRSRFVARMSHALRTPLNGIVGMTGMLAAGELDEEGRRCAARLTDATRNLIGVVNGMLDHARLETGELRLQRSRFSLHEVIEEGCQRRGAEAHARGVELVCYIDEGVPRDVDGDGERLWQVIDTLVANGIEHTDNGEVVVRVVRDGEPGAAGEAGADAGGTRSRYRCDVQDTGSGLSPEHQLELWRAFSDTNRTGGEADEADALGVGLRTANELARRMGGGLDARGRLGEGARFSFSFELGDVEQRDASRPAPRSLAGMRALIVDDNETNRTILTHQLGNWGMQVSSADGGPAALDALRAARDGGHRPDVLVLDLHMPGMDGLELARHIRADPGLGDAPALMLTSSEIDLDPSELDALGIERNLTKPARQSVLHDTLASMLRAPGARAGGAEGAGTLRDASAVAVGPGPGIVSGGAPADGVAPLDLAALDAIRELQRPDKPDLLARVVDVWRGRAPELVGDMRAAVEAGDREALIGAVHGLKSSSSYLGATTIAARCRGLEAALQDDPEPGDEALGALVEALDEECGRVGAALVERTGRAA